MQLLALGYKCIARQRIRVLAADQHADPADRRLDDAEADPVAICPDHLLEESRDDLAMVIEDCAVRVDEQVRVPEATHARTGRLADADRDKDIMPPGSSADALDFGAGHHDRDGRKALEQVVRLDRRLYGSPDREAGEEGFGKRDEPRTVPGRLGDQRAGLVHSGLRVEEDGRHMRSADLEGRILDHQGAPRMAKAIRAGRRQTAAARADGSYSFCLVKS